MGALEKLPINPMLYDSKHLVYHECTVCGTEMIHLVSNDLRQLSCTGCAKRSHVVGGSNPQIGKVD